MPYTHDINNKQATACAVDIREFGVEICNASEVREFLDAIPEPPSVTEARWKIFEAFECGAIGAVEAFRALEAYGCLNSADDCLRSLIAGSRARLMLGDEPQPTPPEPFDVAPGPAKGVRVTSAAYPALEALAEARKGRAA